MLRRVGLAAILGLAQGLALYWVSEGRDGLWTAATLAPFAALVFGPVIVQLSWDRTGRPGFWVLGAAVTGVLAGMAAYAGWSTTAPATWAMGPGGRLFPFWLAGAFIGLVVLPSIQAGGRVTYAAWFGSVTSAALLILQAALFAGIGWLLVWLSAGLFDAIGIDLIKRLMRESYFVWPTLWLLAGVGAQAFLADALDWLKRQILLVLSWLHPIALVIALAFLAALPFTGLQALWATGNATALLLGLAFAIVLLMCATLSERERAGDPPLWRRTFVLASVAVLPIYVALAGYALGLRVQQHGWSLDRVWAALLVAALALLALGYAGVLLAPSKARFRRLETVNLAVFGAAAVALVVLHSPLLDPKEIPARSQEARLLSGKEDAALFDYGYLRFELGRPGERVLRELSAIQSHADAETIRVCSAEALALKGVVWQWQCRGKTPTVAEARTRFTVYPAGVPLEDDFIERIIAKSSERPREIADCLKAREPCRILRVDLNRDANAEYVLMQNGNHGLVFSRHSGAWEEIGYVDSQDYSARSQLDGGLLARGPIESVQKEWDDLRIADQMYVLYPTVGAIK